MGDLRNSPRKFLTEFIDLYKTYPCLWKVKSPQYTNKTLKHAAYQVLKRKLREVDSDANRDMVIRKIDSLRGSFRKELKKVIESQRSGGKVYQPRLWYFEKLLFLVNPDHEAPIAETTLNEFRLDKKFEIVNMDECKSPTPSRSPSPNITNLNSPKRKSFEPLEVVVNKKPSRSPSPNISTYLNTPKRKSFEPLEVVVNNKPSRSPSPNISTYLNSSKRKSFEPLELVNKKPKVEDEFDVIGKNVAHKLRTFSKEIKIVAEKLMNDIFFECGMGNVNKYTRLNLHQIAPVSLNCTAQDHKS